ncbi:MAG: hypothetical protein ACT4PW_00185 [Acidimicrobiia bacterium]
MRVGEDVAGHAVELGQQRLLDDLFGRAVTPDAAVLHGDDVVAGACCLVDVVEDHDDRLAAGVEAGDEVDHLALVGEVEEGRRCCSSSPT